MKTIRLHLSSPTTFCLHHSCLSANEIWFFLYHIIDHIHFVVCYSPFDSFVWYFYLTSSFSNCISIFDFSFVSKYLTITIIEFFLLLLEIFRHFFSMYQFIHLLTWSELSKIATSLLAKRKDISNVVYPGIVHFVLIGGFQDKWNGSVGQLPPMGYIYETPNFIISFRLWVSWLWPMAQGWKLSHRTI